MATVEILPRKVFIITLENGDKIHGKFGTYALRRLCLHKKFNDAQLYEAFTTRLLEILPEYLLFAAENYFRELKIKESFPYDEIDACNWIDDMGGLSSKCVIDLCDYAAESIAGEKKSQKEAA
jgi:hypothetical protein